MDLKTVQEIMKEFGISRTTLYRLVDEGLPYRIIGTRKKMFDPDKVREFIANRRNEVEKKLSIGKEYTNEEIVGIFRCGTMGVMRRSHTQNALVLISCHDKPDRLYEDYWKDNVLYYTGMGQIGDQSLDFGQNPTLATSRETGITVYLFEMFNDHWYRYRGIVELVSDPFEEEEKDAEGNMRVVWKFPLKIVSGPDYLTEEFLEHKTRQAEQTVARMPKSVVDSRAREIDRVVSEITTTTKTYVRSPIIAQYAKYRANGHCELCGAPAPFEVNGEPYLEAHHLVFVSEGGRDSIDNVVALCPNCHRRMHSLRDPVDLRRLKQIVSDKNRSMG